MSSLKQNLMDSQNNKSNCELEFTGNWFIDAGILGFVNLMEEVYGWDLEKLQEKIKENPELVYYGYFPFAYFYKLSQNDAEAKKLKIIEVTEFIEQNKNLGENILEEVWWNHITELFREIWIRKKLEVMHESECYDKKGEPKSHYAESEYRNLIRKREQLINVLVTEERFKNKLQEIFGKRRELVRNGSHNLSIKDAKLFEEKLEDFSDDREFYKAVKKIIKAQKELEKYLNKVWNNVRLKNISNENSVFCRIPVHNSFYKNYLFFNEGEGIFKQFEDLKNLIDGNTNYSEYLSKIDKTISKFLPSDKKFPNITYTEFQVEQITKFLPRLFVYLINFLNAFIYVDRDIGSIFFYSSDLDFTYRVNKKIKIYLNRAKNDKTVTILRVTWRAVIDTLIETETEWSLEDLYLIRYKRISQQDLIGVDYIGIQKLQASVLKDDKLRDALNIYVPVKASDEKIEEGVWILEEFIKNKPLLPHLTRHVRLHLADRISGDNYVGKSLIYASIIDAKIRDLKKNSKIFGEGFFGRYVELPEMIKEDALWSFSIVKIVGSLFEDQNERKSYASLLLTTIKRNNKYRFVNILLKTINERKERMNDIKSLIGFIFSKILSNDTSWKNYAFVFVVSLISDGGGENGKSGV